jgi:hypothetical protein
MSDDINVQEVVDTSVAATSVEETPVEQVAAPVETPKETPAQMSWRQLREKADKAERERDELARQMQNFAQKALPKAPEEEDASKSIRQENKETGGTVTRVSSKNL